MQKVPWSIELDEPMKLKDELIKKELRYHVWSWVLLKLQLRIVKIAILKLAMKLKYN